MNNGELNFALTFFYTQKSTHFNIWHRQSAYGLPPSLSFKDRMNSHGLIWRQPHYDVYFTVAHYIDVIMSHNERDGVSSDRRLDCLLHFFSRRSKKTSKLRVTGLCEGNSMVTGEFPAQRASSAENVSIWWHHHVLKDTERWYCTKCRGGNLSHTVSSRDFASHVRSNAQSNCILCIAQYAVRLCIGFFPYPEKF